MATKVTRKTPNGCKQTDVGIIPNDWDIFEFGQLVDYTKGFAFKSKNYRTDGTRVLRVSDTTFDSIKEKNQIYIDEGLGNEYRKWRIEEDDLILSTVGSKPPMYDSMVGKVIIIPRKHAGSLLNQNAVLIRSKRKSKYKQQILLNHFRTKRYLRYIESIYRGNANQASITLAELFQFQIPLPKLDSEQAAIAEALSDADALISRLEQLIAKKRNIKQGAMQELLTGEKRLPGFSGEWEVKSLEQAINCLDNLRVPLNDSQRLSMKGDYPYCGANGVLDFIDSYMIDDDIILIAEDGGYFDEYHYRPIAYRMKGKCWVNNHAHILKAKEGYNQDFVFYSLVHKNILRFLASGTRAKLNKSEMYKIEIDTPPAKEEQAAIAQILNDMDAEIEQLEQKLDKYRMIKQGMMQELLTGKTRLV